ncbi:MAG: hypothetical protein R3242_04045 [Akkermansiaceae bacterium]|nr:hypothetical protein [Akkermansiaceae bacterium]
MQIPIALFAGACIGVIGTYFAMRDGVAATEPNPVHDAETPEGTDPFEYGASTELSSGDRVGHGKMDMSDPLQRDICISLWYLEMSDLVDNLELRTGHKFERQVGKVYAGPVEILEEQAAFMREFLAETESISSNYETNENKDNQQLPNNVVE